jgi:predicted GNAT superfamily acetyltransferase
MIEIRQLVAIEDFIKLPEIEKSAWGFSDKEVEPHHLMTRVQKYGGLVQGLFLDEVMIGFSYAIIGKWKGSYFIYSHMVAVRQELQGKGYGFLLKKGQREAILSMGYSIIRWNFDPLESLNSYFNMHRLGVICEEYEWNVYGEGTCGLHRGLPTDRLIATWYLESDRVIKKINKKDPPIFQDVSVNQLNTFSNEIAYIEIPKDIRTLRESDLKAAYEWRMRTRDLFETAFREKYVAEDIVFSMDQKRIFYKLKRSAGVF